ncbi:MAG: diacylglycerol kinase family protein [Verrucomicrobiota bacterium JB023]|nr:diacylglycerol kinase family protein [Verrucomicrobiota bacterium JB023]
MNPTIVINKASGSGEFADQSRQEELLTIFREQASDAKLIAVEAEDFADAIDEALAGPCDTLIVGGGDGSITSTASRVAQAGKTLGVIPLGTFNLEARDLGISLDPLEAGRQLATAKPRSIDLLEINGEPCLCTLILGFYPELSRMRQEYHGKAWWQKSFRTAYETLVLATRTPILDLQLETPLESSTGSIRRRTRMTAISPGAYVEEFGLIPHREELASGLIHAYVSSHLSRSELLKASLSYLSGKLFSTDDMEVVTGRELVINIPDREQIPAMIDGETLSLKLPLSIKLKPKALSVLPP